MTAMEGEGERCRKEPQSLTCFYVILSDWRSAINLPPSDNTRSTQAADWSFHPTRATLILEGGGGGASKRGGF